ncbi:hypothetical protein [Streptomyces sp. SHP 1-2]|uniref:hypothetical protein n=1 Tax=Streptomyces sp. SHP 1-2 TaxID=2769489 RepID=UPI002238B106|nr:hypothetical protein [Streptomyces sp. SHP 1-2]MCW5253715.1 hypothetical protein [Streptomyces sp. SHP 1-2]
MSGNHYYYGDSVNMHGTRDSIGMVKYQNGDGAEQLAPAVVAAIGELHRMIEDLRVRLDGPNAQLVADSLPALNPAAAVSAQERHRALVTVAGVVSTLGAVGQPVAEAVRAVIELLSG